MLEICFEKKGWFVGGMLTFCGLAKGMVSDDMCDESCSAIFDE
jgi:hypothetical protein